MPRALRCCCISLVLAAAGCGGSSNNAQTYTIGGVVTGLQGSGLVLQNNGTDTLGITSNGPFTFGAKVDDKHAYAVTVKTQPSGPNQTCTVSQGTGTVAGANVTNVAVACASAAALTYTIGGTASGLTQNYQIILDWAGGSGAMLVLNADGPFAFSAQVPDGATYQVSEGTILSGQTCALSNSSGTVHGANVTNVGVACTPWRTVGGTISGLGAGVTTDLTLTSPAGNSQLSALGNGAFTFVRKLPDGSNFSVSASKPSFWACDVTNGSGTVAGNVTNVTVACHATTVTVGGTVSGLVGSGLVLKNNGGDALPVSGNGPFTFATHLGQNAAYAVTVSAHPAAPQQTCQLQNATGTITVEAPVTNVQVVCPTVVQALYPVNGGAWNAYLKQDGTTLLNATDQPCAFTSGTPARGDCLHGGELRRATGSAASCSGLSAADALGAFDWACDDSSGLATFYSTGLKRTTRLSDLIDFSAAAWKLNNLIVTGGGTALGLGGMTGNVTPLEKWWPNPVVERAAGQAMNAAGTVYILSANPAAALAMAAKGIALVAKPGTVLTGSTISTLNQSFLWLEAEVDSGYILWDAATFSVMRGVRSDHSPASSGIQLVRSIASVMQDASASSNALGGIVIAGSNNVIDNATAASNPYVGFTVSGTGHRLSHLTSKANGSYGQQAGIYLTGDAHAVSDSASAGSGGSGFELHAATHSRIVRAFASNNAKDGFYESGGTSVNSDNVYVDSMAANNLVNGFEIAGDREFLLGVIAAGNGNAATPAGMGIRVAGTSVLVADATAVNNGWLGVFGMSTGLTLMNVVSANNARGLELSSMGGVHVENLVAVHDAVGVALYTSTAVFAGALMVGNNSANDCYNDGSSTGVTGACANQGSSTATLTTGVSVASSFIGKVAAGDSVNASDDSTGLADHDTITDWLHFETACRGWGMHGSAFPNTDHRGACTTGTCSLWDFGVSDADTVLLDTRPKQLAGNAANTRSHNGVAFLLNAREVMGDGVGNDNGLCESNEVCVWTSNYGGYQGHGSLSSAGTFTDGDTLTGITLKQTFFNGYTP